MTFVIKEFYATILKTIVNENMNIIREIQGIPELSTKPTLKEMINLNKHLEYVIENYEGDGRFDEDDISYQDGWDIAYQ